MRRFFYITYTFNLYAFAFYNALKWYYTRNVKGYYTYLSIYICICANAINYKGICGINTIDTLTSRIFFDGKLY